MRTINETYNFNFTQAMYNVPLIAPIAKKFRLEVTIQRAILNEAGGWMEVMLTGSPEEIGRAIADLSTKGVSVTGPIANTLSPTETEVEPTPAYVGRGT